MGINFIAKGQLSADVKQFEMEAARGRCCLLCLFNDDCAFFVSSPKSLETQAELGNVRLTFNCYCLDMSLSKKKARVFGRNRGLRYLWKLERNSSTYLLFNPKKLITLFC